VAGQSTQTQCKELAKSVNQELRQELMKTDYTSYEEQLAAAGTDNQLWFYLRYNLWQEDTWPYYKEGVTGHNEGDSYRYFTMEVPEAAAADKVLVTLYWEIDSEAPETETDKSFTLLHVKIETEKGNYGYTMETVYALTVSPYDGAVGYGDLEGLENTTINPSQREIDKNEKWVWTPD
jgi:hypothetical protein